MQVLLDSINKPVPAILACIWLTLALHFRAHCIDNDLLLIESVQLGNLSRAEQIIDVHKEAFVNDLSLSEEEEDLLGPHFW